MLRLLSVKGAVAMFAGLAVAAGGGLAWPLPLATTPPPTRPRRSRVRSPSPPPTRTPSRLRLPDWAPQPIPARMLSPGVPVPVAPSVLRMRNGWLVSDGRTLVAVYAGAAGNDPSAGRVVIVRQDLVAGKQTVRTVDAGSTGALAIAAAPLGSSVETSAQTGAIRSGPGGPSAPPRPRHGNARQRMTHLCLRDPHESRLPWPPMAGPIE